MSAATGDDNQVFAYRTWHAMSIQYADYALALKLELDAHAPGVVKGELDS